MKYFCLFFFCLIFSGLSHEFTTSKHNLQPASGMETFGDMHGEVAIDSSGLIYMSVANGEKAGIQIFSKDGKYLRNLPNAPHDLHGFVIKKEEAGEFLYGSLLNAQEVIKMTLEGEVVLKISGSKIPDKFKHPKKKTLKLTSVDVGPNGDIYTVDGYGMDYIHRFDKDGNYKGSFAGRKAPYNFANCHKIFIDPRFTPARILCCDRKNGRLVHLSLQGEVIGEFATGLRRPSAVDFYKDNIAVAEIYGRVTLLNKKGDIIKTLSDNAKIKGGNKWPKEGWKEGLVITPHGICFDQEGNIIVSEYNKFGRALKFDLKQ
ncbi:MAG: hypothetical protein MK132_23830 [Lentisphaerales bacterium]|nr:hypothetical protein [Lentisphaerales bacterium]